MPEPRFSPAWLHYQDFSRKVGIQAWLTDHGVNLETCAGFDLEHEGAKVILVYYVYDPGPDGNPQLRDGEPVISPRRVATTWLPEGLGHW